MNKFDLVVIGGGAGGLVAASGAAQLGARVALIDRKETLGGDCLNYGCVPTKRLVHSARVASIARRAPEFGVETGHVAVDFPAVMEGMRRVRDRIGEHDDPERFRKMGIEVMTGEGSFMDSHTFMLGGGEVRGRKFIIATGSSPMVPDVDGMMESGALTNETALELTRLPATMVIIGAGPIAVEFAQVFARLGTKVTLLERRGYILPKEDRELSDLLRGILAGEGIRIETCQEMRIKCVDVERGLKRLELYCSDGHRSFTADEILVAMGRTPNVEGLGLEAAGVEHGPKGIKVDRHLRTTARNIYACGDVIGHYLFTHVAEYQAGVALGNALFPIMKRKLDYRAVPWVTFTDPELARVGLTEAEAKERHGAGGVHVYRHEFKDVDRAVIEGEERGLVKLVCDGKGRLLGAHILGTGAGELLQEYVLAMQSGLPVSKISRSIHVYPTVGQAVKRASDQYYREKLFSGWFPKVARLLIRLRI